MKRLIDILGSGALLILLSPLIAAAALAIVLTDPGPVIFRQGRLGCNGKPFSVLKFRSMRVNAPDIRNADGSAFSGEDDPRVTPVGRFIRRTSLDELPQLFNVLKGEMSLVGPRPDQVDQMRYYDEIEKRKLLVKPGITGLAQISGRNDIPWKVRKALDVRYVDERSLLLDCEILLKTIPYVLLRKGIHAEVSREI
ncbi:MAG TPA: sugar transferase [Bryobacteraceae bacterium]|jgi:lipopolysaccharide/colanic/teichoic acid biosynthesis glycosyltransferase